MKTVILLLSERSASRKTLERGRESKNARGLLTVSQRCLEYAVISMRGAARGVAARTLSSAPRERDLIERGPLVEERPHRKNDILKYHIFIEKYHILFMTFIRYHLDIEK